MMLGENDGLKGCAARPGKPAPALDPLALTRRLAVMPFRGGRVPRKRSVMSTGRAVTFLSGRNCDFSNGDRHLYSVPNATRRRIVEVHSTASEVRILEDGHLIAVHPVLEGRGRRRISAGHRSLPPPANSNTPRHSAAPARVGETVTPRPLAFYDAVAQRLASSGPQP
jgi:hypothetical protein